MGFPYHQVPDGSVLLLHYYTLAMVVLLIPLAVVWDNHAKREPVVTATVAIVGLFAFLFVWPRYPSTGAVLALGMHLLAIVAIAYRLVLKRDAWPLVPLAIALVLALVALDDVLQYAFGWPMPIDQLWKGGLREVVTGG